MHCVTLSAVLIVGLLVAGAIAVHPDYILNKLAGSLPSASPKETEESIELAALATSRQCCKLGERMGYRGLPCNLELHVTSRAENMVFKQKQKHHEPQESEPWKRMSVPAFDAAKCSGYKKLFEKCCSHWVRDNWRWGVVGEV